MITITNKRLDSTRTAAVRVRHQSIRPRTFYAVAESEGQPPHSWTGEVMHLEANGLIFVEVLHQLSAVQCAALPKHSHCTGEDHAYDVRDTTLVHDPCCIVTEKYPVSVFIDTPVRDPLAVPLGDNFIVTVRAANGPFGHQYDVG